VDFIHYFNMVHMRLYSHQSIYPVFQLGYNFLSYCKLTFATVFPLSQLALLDISCACVKFRGCIWLIWHSIFNSHCGRLLDWNFS
jgi:hypothetical protein